MFTAYAYAISHASLPRDVCDRMAAAAPGASHLEVAAVPAPLSAERLVKVGHRTRAGFIEKVTTKIRRGRTCGDLRVHELLIDVSDINAGARHEPPIQWPEVQEYLRRMRSWGSRDCWGGAAELTVLAHMSMTQIFLLEHFPHSAEWQLLTGPLGPEEWKLRIALVYTGTHYDAVRLPFRIWDSLQQRV